LRKFTLSGELPCLTRSLGIVHLLRLTHLDITILCDTPARFLEIPTTCRTLASRFGSTLQNLSISCLPGFHHGVSQCSLLSLVEPLSDIRDLQELRLHINALGPTVTHRDIHSVAVLLPNIRKLSLIYGANPRLPVGSLVEFTKHCPDLRELEMPLLDPDPSLLLPTCPTDSPSNPCHRLERLSFCTTKTPMLGLNTCIVFLNNLFASVQFSRSEDGAHTRLIKSSLTYMDARSYTGIQGVRADI